MCLVGSLGPLAATSQGRITEGSHHRTVAHDAKASSHHRTVAHGAKAKREPVLVIKGAGDGHGVGMSQWGAEGYAEHGWSDLQILGHYYSGTAIGHISKKRKVRVLIGGSVRKVPIEAYVRGVVAGEMPASWPLAALEAQAIASRSYAITADAGGRRFDVYDDSRSQVYIGKAAETPLTNRAVRETAGEVVTYDGSPVLTPFFASSGGMTENIQDSFLGSAPEPWLVGVEDPYDSGPLHRWTVKVGFRKAARELSGLVNGSFRGIEVIERGFSPRVISAYVLGSKGRTEVSGPELAARLGVWATWMHFSVKRGGKVRPEPDLSGGRGTSGGGKGGSGGGKGGSGGGKSPSGGGSAGETGPGGGTTSAAGGSTQASKPPTGLDASGGLTAP